MSDTTDQVAFPCDRLIMQDGNLLSSTGMSLRDYFAARAMQSGIMRWGGAGDMCDEAGIAHSTLAKQSYLIADAMLAARATSDKAN